MQKIMFNDKYGLTEAVLEGRKTMTRRLPGKEWKDIMPGLVGQDLSKANTPFKVGEVVAIAQNYKDVREGGYPVDSRYDAFREADWGIGVNGALKGSAGETNKMFVKADLMPHHVRITKVRVERLHSITVADCFKEGINTIVEGESKIGNPWGWDTKVDYFKRDNYLTPLQAFAALIDKVSGKGTWASNPWVFVYEFELVK